jgi:alpha,alpha-trehalose phosphorylase
VHSIVASDLDLSDQAYEYFRRSARIDLDDINGNTDSGLHCAALGGTWQAVMRGFLGLRAGADGPTVRPALPPAWRSVRTQVSFRGRWLTIEADRERATVRPAGGR